MNVILDWDESYKKGIITSDGLGFIRNHFSIPNPAKKLYQFKNASFISDRISIITSTGRFDLGMFYEIQSFLHNDRIKYDVVITKLLQDKIDSIGLKLQNPVIPKLNLELRDYQYNSLLLGLNCGCGIYMIATAGGKTLLMAYLIESLRTNLNKTCLLITQPNLIEQTYKDFIEYGIPEHLISKWSGENDYEVKPIMIASVSILYTTLGDFRVINAMPKYDYIKKKPNGNFDQYVNELKAKNKQRKKTWATNKKKYLNDLANIDCVLIDECHSIRKDNEINNILKNFKTENVWGFTGSLPEDKIDCWNIIGKIGPVLTTITSKQLRDEGHISQVKAKLIKLHYKNPPKFKLNVDNLTEAYNIENDFLFKSTYRNKVIKYLAENLENNTLILIDRLEHGTILNDLLKNNTKNKTIYYIYGEVENEDREKVRALMEINNNIICIAMSKIFATGINIKNLNNIIFVQSGKAKIRFLQSIGRGLRLHGNKAFLLLIDIVDMLEYGERHHEKRLEYYKTEQIPYEIKEYYEK